MNEAHRKQRAPEAKRKFLSLFAGSGAARSGRLPQTYGIYSIEELQQLLEYERRRCRRTGEQSSLVLCYLNGSSDSERKTRHIVQAITHTVRETDHVGWISEHELGVVLSGTPTEHAADLAAKLQQSGLITEADLSVQRL